MKRASLLAILAAPFCLLLPIGVALGQQTPPAATVVYRSTFETVAPGLPFDLVMTVTELEPGAWTLPHTHTATSFITILEGEWTNVSIVDGQRTEPETHRAGDTVVEHPWGVHQAGNLSVGRTRILTTRLQPKDTPATIGLPIESVRPGAPLPRGIYQAGSEVANISGPVDVYQSWLEWAPGSRTPAHFHAGLELAIVTQGELTVTKGTTTTTLRPGDQIVNGVGEIHAAANNGSENAVALATQLIASGVPQSFPTE